MKFSIDDSQITILLKTYKMERINRTLLRRGRLSAKELLDHPKMKVKDRRKPLKIKKEPQIKRVRKTLDLNSCYMMAFLRYGSLIDFSNTVMTVAEISR